MSSEEIEPDAYLFHYDISECAVSGDHKELASKYAMKGLYDGDNIEGENCAEYINNEPLFSAETILQLIKDKRAEFNNGRSSEHPQKVLTELLEEVNQS